MSLESAFVRILISDSAGRAAAGAGFLAAPRHVLTCAHVVNTALRRAQTAPEQPDTLLALDFPLLPDQTLLQAKVLRWLPVRENAAVGELEDIAVLELPEDAPLPAGAQPAPLVLFEEHWGRQVRLHGFSVPAGTYANLTLQGLNTQGLIELHHQGSGVVAPGFSGTAVWSVQENAVCGMAVAVWKELNTAYMIPAVSLFKACPEIDIYSRSVNPYKGLEAFREKDARFYFGRKDDADELRKKIEQQPFTAVIGASGSGKSSLVFAGLLPILRQSGDWLLAACRPKQQPFHELAASLIPFLYEDELERVKKSRQCAADLLSGELHLPDLLQRIAERNACRRFLLLVDQFEELYTLNADRALARAFVAQLLAAQAEGFRAVITLRADFLEAALGDEAFAKTLNACQPLYLSPLDSHGLRLAVERPAELLGIRFEAGLADLIVADVGTEPGSLPLLEFCLTQLWEQQAFRQISHAAYKSGGGVRQALARHADTVLAEFEQEAVRRIFLKLVRPGQGTEDTRQVAALADFQEEQRGLIKQLADRRLLVTSGDEAGQQVEVAHEALIRHWQTLRKWVDAERDFLVWRDKLRVLLRQWQESGHDEGALLRGLPLGEALQWRGSHAEHLDEKELEFIRESEAARRKQRRRKGIAAGAGLLIAVAVMVVFFVLWKDAERQKVVAEQERQHAVEQRGIAERKTFEAEQQTLSANYNLAKAFEEKAFADLKEHSNESYKQAVIFTSKVFDQNIPKDVFVFKVSSVGSLFSSSIFNIALAERWMVKGDESDVNSTYAVAFSPYGKTIAYTFTSFGNSTSNSIIRLLDAENGNELTVFKGHRNIVRSVAFSPDGKTIVSASDDNTVRLWDVASGKELAMLKGHEADVKSAAFSPDGKTIVSASNDTTIRFWDVRSGKEQAVLRGHKGNVKSAAFSPDGKTIVSASDDTTIRLWDVESGKEKAVFKGNGEFVLHAEFSPDGERIISVFYDRTIRLLDASSGKEISDLNGHEGYVYNALFSSDGKTIVSASSDTTIRLWDAESKKELAIFKGNKGDISSAAFSPDGRTIVSSHDYNFRHAIRLWDVASDKKVFIFKKYDVKQENENAIFSGRTIACNYTGVITHPFSANRMIRISDTATGKALAVFDDGNDFQNSRSGRITAYNGKIMADTEYWGKEIQVWDKGSGNDMPYFNVDDWIASIALSPDSRIGACGSKDGLIRLWDVASGKELTVLTGHKGVVNRLSFSPDGRLLISASWNYGTYHIYIWDVRPYVLFFDGTKATPLYFTFMEGVKFLWQVKLDGLEFVPDYTPTLIAQDGYNFVYDPKFRPLLNPPPPGQSKFDQVLEWAEKQQGK